MKGDRMDVQNIYKMDNKSGPNTTTSDPQHYSEAQYQPPHTKQQAPSLRQGSESLLWMWIWRGDHIELPPGVSDVQEWKEEASNGSYSRTEEDRISLETRT